MFSPAHWKIIAILKNLLRKKKPVYRGIQLSLKYCGWSTRKMTFYLKSKHEIWGVITKDTNWWINSFNYTH